MAFKAYCDVCNKQCNERTTKRWENISGELGLEVIVLRGPTPVGDMHLCDGCIAEMFWVACNRDKDNPINQLHVRLGVEYESVGKTEKELKAKQIELDARLEQLRQQQEEMDLKKVRLDARETKIVAAEVSALKWEKAVAQAEAKGYQRAIDEHEYPEYVDAIEKNSIRRGS